MFLVYDNFGRFLAKRRIAKGEERKGMAAAVGSAVVVASPVTVVDPLSTLGVAVAADLAELLLAADLASVMTVAG